MTAQRIQELRSRLGMTQAELAEKINVSPQTVHGWEAGLFKPKGKRLYALAEALGVDASELRDPTPASGRKKIPILGVIPAGIPIEAIEDIIDWEDIPAEWHGEYFGLRVRGDSMFPKYIQGDTIIVRVQNTCDNGQDCVVQVNGFDATLKQVYVQDNCVELRSINPAYDPMVFKDVKILGVVAELRRKMLPL